MPRVTGTNQELPEGSVIFRMQESTKNQQVQENKWQEKIDRKALFACYIRKMPALLLLAVAGAVVGSGLSLLSAFLALRTPIYISETEYYIVFAAGRLDAKDYYNDFTWNDVIATDDVLGKAMESLGSELVREEVKEMITADILSDVRYLTITIQGENVEHVEKVRDALQAALEDLPRLKEELDTITKIEDLGIVQKKVPLFAWRAALLGAVLAIGFGIFAVAFWFAMGTVIYTKADIVQYFGLPVFGMLYAKGNRKEGKQEKRLISSLRSILEREDCVYLADAAEGAVAAAFLKELGELKRVGEWKSPALCQRLQVFDETNCPLEGKIILVVPFGIPCREKTADEIMYLRQQGYLILGAILTEVDKQWTKIYWSERNRK